MRKGRKILFVLLFSLVFTSQLEAKDLGRKIKLDGRETLVRETAIVLNGDLVYTKPISFIHPKDNYTLVPVRFITESMGAKVGWDQAGKLVTVKEGGKSIIMKIDSSDVYINGVKKKLEPGISPKLIEGNTMVPLRFLSESLGYEVSFDENLRLPIINKTPPKEILDSPGENRITRIRREDYKGRDALVVYATGDLDYKKSKLSNPSRIVIDLMDTSISKTYGEYRFNIKELDKLRVSQFDGREIYKTDRNIVRMVMDLDKDYIDTDLDIVKGDRKLILIPRAENNKQPIKTSKDNKKISYERRGNTLDLKLSLSKDSSYYMAYNKENRQLELLLEDFSLDSLEDLNIDDNYIDSIELDSLNSFTRLKIDLAEDLKIEDRIEGGALVLSFSSGKFVR